MVDGLILLHNLHRLFHNHGRTQRPDYRQDDNKNKSRTRRGWRKDRYGTVIQTKYSEDNRRPYRLSGRRNTDLAIGQKAATWRQRGEDDGYQSLIIEQCSSANPRPERGLT